MPRKPKMYPEGIPCHIIHRGNNRDTRFSTPLGNTRFIGQIGKVTGNTADKTRSRRP